MGSTDDLPPHVKPEHVYTIPFDREAFDRACDAIYLRLGYLLVQANMLDDVVVDLYWVVVQRPQHEVIAETREWTFGMLVPRFLAAFKQHVKDAALLKRLDELEPRLRESVGLRNEFIHATWSISADGWTERRRKLRDGRAREQCLKMNPEHIEAAAEKLGGLAETLWELWDDVVPAMGGHLPPQMGEIRDGITYQHAREYGDLTKR